ncbi:MAG: sulfotransferase domain-containing protein [Acidobacteria bacterium]|nr:sulfotransferase domain-containing protein [Acidobacteriota bacterium]
MTIHAYHRVVPPHRVAWDRIYPFRTATGPIKEYVKAKLKGETSDVSLWQAIGRTVETMAHCYPRHHDVIWATAQRSGHNWFSMIYTILVERLFNGRVIDIQDVSKYRAHVYRHVSIRYDLNDHLTEFYFHLPIPRLMHNHSPYYLWYSNRKVLLQIRHPYDVIISKYYHGQYFLTMSFARYLLTGTVRGVLEFFESWGRALSEGRLRTVYCLKYESLRSDPVTEVQQVLEFLEFPAVPISFVENAVDRTNSERVRNLEMQRRGLDDPRLVRGARSGKIGQSTELSPSDRAALESHVRKHLTHTVGYLLQLIVVILTDLVEWLLS